MEPAAPETTPPHAKAEDDLLLHSGSGATRTGSKSLANIYFLSVLAQSATFPRLPCSEGWPQGLSSDQWEVDENDTPCSWTSPTKSFMHHAPLSRSRVDNELNGGNVESFEKMRKACFPESLYGDLPTQHLL